MYLFDHISIINCFKFRMWLSLFYKWYHNLNIQRTTGFIRYKLQRIYSMSRFTVWKLVTLLTLLPASNLPYFEIRHSWKLSLLHSLFERVGVEGEADRVLEHFFQKWRVSACPLYPPKNNFSSRDIHIHIYRHKSS